MCRTMDNKRYIETIVFMGWNAELTQKGFFAFLENNQEIRLIGKTRGHRKLHAIGEDGTHYFAIYPIKKEIMREIGGCRIDQLILCDDGRWIIYEKHREIIHEIRDRFTEQIPEEYKILFYEY